MAKAAKTAQKKDLKASADAKNWTKVIRAIRSPKSGAYTFKENIVHKDKVNDFLKNRIVFKRIEAICFAGGFFYYRTFPTF
ncbi:MAG: DUF4295 domain-containing protein [Bacteroidetes bacterium]|nr:DUF4295 domain-containing protein [Bacteroidota bacterium]